MSSKQLDSILKNIPSATVTAERAEAEADIVMVKKKEETERVVAIVPKSLKDAIKHHLRNHKGETERTLVLKGLKAIGFDIKNEWLVDKRTTR
jgi:hypothetical protein